MDDSFPELPDCVIRNNALALAHDYAATPQEAMAIADSFVEYIENGSGGVRFVCNPKLKKTVTSE